MKHLIILLLISVNIQAQNVSKDIKMGQEGKAKIESTYGIYEDQEKTKLLVEVGNKLVKNLDKKLFDYNFYIVDMAEPNAFALPGGQVFISRGILALANNEEELAGVMGHEIIHSNKRHSIKNRKKVILPAILTIPQALTGAILGESAGRIFSPLSKGGKALMASHSRKDEYEADKLGSQLAANSGYDPKSLATILDNLNNTVEIFTGTKEEPSYFADHPLTAKRIKKIEKESTILQIDQSTKIFKDRSAFLSFIDGITVGQDPKQGIFQDNKFLHPEMNFKLNIPENWLTENSSSAVVAGDTTGSAMFTLELESKYKSANEAANAYAENIGKKINKPIKPESKKINEFQAKLVKFEAPQNNETIHVWVYWLEDGEIIYKISGVSVTKFEKTITESIESFCRLSLDDKKSINKRILKIVEAHKGEDLKSISERSNNVIPVNLTAAVNGVKEDKVFDEGELVKVVIQVPYK